MHEHNDCSHEELKYCAKCDVAYCPECGQEWHTQKIQYVYQGMSPSYTITVGDTYLPQTSPTITYPTFDSSAVKYLEQEICKHVLP